ncbi:MAG: sigma 54-interacting transcriptional regulator [Deltaproteobacteria bacterium]|nr:sigma 54-interacting transcriptional regulator [Deltaproteobacteria bacterium]
MIPKTLKMRIVLFVAVSVVLSNAAVAFLAAHDYWRSLDEAMRVQASSLSQGLALQAADLILINDIVSIQRLLDYTKAGNSEIGYIFLQRGDNVLGHTFDSGVPAGLVGGVFANPITETRFRNVTSLTGGEFLDVAQPMPAGILRLGLNKAPYREKLHELLYEISSITLLLLFAAVAVCLILAGKIANPLEQLVEATERITLGDWSGRVEVKGRVGEVIRLADSFNAMADQIRFRTTRLEEQKENLEHAQQQTRLSCSIIQEIGALSTIREIGTYLVLRLNQILRCQRLMMVLGRGSGDLLYLVSDSGFGPWAPERPIDTLYAYFRQNPETVFVAASDPLPFPVPEGVDRFGRLAVLPIVSEKELVGALFVVYNEKEASEPSEISVAELVLDQASGSIRRAFRQEEELNRSALGAEKGLGDLLGRAPNMRSVFKLIQDVAPTDSTVLILGESGTGKELVAKAIHQNSPRRNNPFIVIDCSSYPTTLLESELFGHERGAFTGAVRQKPGRFEMAQGGAVFLDEIGDLQLSAQVKLLRVLQTQKFERLGGEKTISLNVRILAATNKNLLNLVKDGKFREDLFYRLNVFPITLPPLRERLNDVPLLARHFLAGFSAEQGKELKDFSKEAMQLLLEYPWPGNVRELENTIERAVILAKGRTVEPLDLPNSLREGRDASSTATLDYRERTALEEALDDCGWNKKAAADKLGISRTTLYRKIRKHHLDEPTRH